MHITRPNALKQGACIGIVSPSSPVPAFGLNKGIAWLESKGFKVKLGKSVYESERFLAGSDQARAQDINYFFKDPCVDAIFASRGGYGTPRLLDLIEYDFIKQNPKIFVGFSDTTALQNALLTKSSLVTYSGFTLYADTRQEKMSDLTTSMLWNVLNNESQAFDGFECFGNKKSASGHLIGGCLSLVVGLLGTPYMPKTKGNILVLEDVGEEPYRIDRMMAHLSLAGVFDQINGLVLGNFYRCTAKDPNDGTLDDVLNAWAKCLDKPVIKGIPYGHQYDRCILPFGAKATIDAHALHISGKDTK